MTESTMPETNDGRLYPLYDSGAPMATWRELFEAPEGTKGISISGTTYTVHRDDEAGPMVTGVTREGGDVPPLYYRDCAGHEDEDLPSPLIVITA